MPDLPTVPPASDPVPLPPPWFRQSSKIIPVLVLIGLLIPTTVFLRERVLFRPKASNSMSVQINPGIINQTSSPQIGQPVYLSATAVNDIGQPITSEVAYSWGISSTFQISPTLKPNGNLATFTPFSTGSGTLWVSAVTPTASAIRYIDICIGVPCPTYSNPTPTPTPLSTPTPLPSSTPTPIPISTNWGQAIHFRNTPGGTPTYLTLTRGTTAKIDLAKEFTLEFWFKLTDISPLQRLLKTSDDHLMVSTTTSNGFTRINVQVSDGTNFDVFAAAGNVIQKDVWNHFALSYLPSLDGGSFISYLNGSSTYHSYQPFGKTVPFTDPGADIYVSQPNLPSGSGILDGLVDEIRISSVARYPTQTGPGTYTLPTSPFVPDTQTLTLFHLNVSYVDSSSNSIVLTPTGSVVFDTSNITVTPTPTPTPTPPAPTPTLTPTPIAICNVADLNKDGVVNGTDYSILANDFLTVSPTNPRSDINHDDVVDIIDYSLYVYNLLNTQPTGACQ